MKLTWFGGTSVRVHIGGSILVVDAAVAPAKFDAAELVAGADQVIANFGAGLPKVDAARWKPGVVPRMLDAGEALPPVEAMAIGDAGVLIAAAGEPPLLLLKGPPPELGRWVESAVVGVFGDAATLQTVGLALLAERIPRLVALGGAESAIDASIPVLRDHLDGAGLVSLEAALAVEI